MARRGRKRKIKLNVKKDTMQSAIAIVMLLLAVLIFISFLAPNYTLNAKIKELVLNLFGTAGVILPFVLVVGGLLYAQIRIKYVELRVFLGLTGLVFSMAVFFSAVGFLDGGSVGNGISDALTGLISKPGTAVLMLSIVLISGVFTLDVSLAQIAEFFGIIVSFVKEKLPKRREASAESEVEINSGGVFASDSRGDNSSEPEILEPSFEVIPSLSEPKSLANQNAAIGVSISSAVPGLPYSDKVWESPPLDLLTEPSKIAADRGDVNERAEIIVETLKSFGVVARVVEKNFGPSVTQYALEAASGTKISKVVNLNHDLALALASPTGSVRIEAPIPGKSLIGIEVPNNTRVPVYFKELITSDAMRGMKSKLGIVLGKDVSGLPLVYDIGKMPHLLVAGSTGSGKSVFLHSLIFSILFRCSPQECKFIFIDPKRVELVSYEGIPHLAQNIITDISKAASVFRWAVSEMERRYKLLEQAKVRNIDAYNEKSGFQALNYLVIVVDELAEIMVADPAQVEKSIIRLAQLARAVGIHLVLTVQRPSTDVITGLIKANIPCRVAFNVTSQIDSRVIIDQPGAEKLLGKGDMLFVPPDVSKPVRIQGALVSDKETTALVNYLKSTGIEPEIDNTIVEENHNSRSVAMGGGSRDDLFDEAVEAVVSAGKASASLLQRRLSVGYARAARILDELEAEGIIGPSQGSKPRDIMAKSIGVGEDGLDDSEEVIFEDGYVS